MKFVSRSAVAQIVAAWFLLMAAMPVDAAPDPWVKPETFTLDNGLEVVVVPDHRAPVVTHMIWYKVGAADEPLTKSGIAHFLEHLMFKGTDMVAPGEFAKIVARNGGRGNAFTSYDYTAYFQNVARDRLELVMGLEADRMQNLRLTDEVVLPERDVILEERAERTDNDPAALLSEHLSATQFLSHPYGIPIIGWKHEISRLTTEDALEFYRTYYVPTNAVLVVAGDITAQELRPLAEKTYAMVPSAPVPKRIRPQEPPQLAPREVVMRDERVRQPSWQRSYLVPSYTTADGGEAVALDVLSEVLGGGTTSRLYRRLVVEEAVASAAGTYYASDALDDTRFAVYLSPRPGVDIITAAAAAETVLDEIVENGVRADEVERAKRQLLAAAVYSRDSLDGMARIFGTALAVGQTVNDVVEWPDRVATVTAEDVTAVARRYLVLRRSATGILDGEVEQ